MATSSAGSKPFESIGLPDGTDPLSKGIIRRVQVNEGIFGDEGRSCGGCGMNQDRIETGTDRMIDAMENEGKTDAIGDVGNADAMENVGNGNGAANAAYPPGPTDES